MRATLAVIMAAGLLVAPMASSVHDGAVIPSRVCASEDAAGPCLWDASTQGNGVGRSFWVDACGGVHYLGAAG